MRMTKWLFNKILENQKIQLEINEITIPNFKCADYTALRTSEIDEVLLLQTLVVEF